MGETNKKQNKIMIHKFSKLLGVTPEQMIEKNRKSEMTEIRCLYAKLRHEKQDQTFESIGRELERSHATVWHAVRKANDLLNLNDPALTKKWLIVRGLREY